jgi:sec-independent protein translocase protein TatB
MIDIGWSEMAVVALVALLILGPKELPQAMRMAASWIKKARSVTREVQSGINDMIRDAELEDARKAVQSAQPGNLEKAIGDAVDPSGSVSQSLSDVEKETRKAETEAKSAVKDDAAPSAGEAPQEAKDTGERATIIEQPTVIAPPHSLNPPPRKPDPEPDPQAAPDTGGDGTQKRA